MLIQLDSNANKEKMEKERTPKKILKENPKEIPKENLKVTRTRERRMMPKLEDEIS